MDQRIINLFDEYTHKPLSRDEFLSRLAKLTGGMAAAVATLPLLEVNYAHAATVAHADERLLTERITYPGEGTEMKGYLARPAAAGYVPAVVVIHENRGLNPHTEDVARRLALAGFLAMAPDALSANGGTPADADAAREQIGKLDAAQTRSNFMKAVTYLQTRPDGTGKVGCVGFCWGGAMSNQLAVNVPTLRAAVPFYGRQPDPADVPKIKAAVQLHYAGLDERINQGIAAYEEALKKAGTRYELHLYEGAQHAFLNDTAPTRYNEPAAKLAWDRTVAFLKQELTR
jgi:carboxymethylenebutenolidase